MFFLLTAVQKLYKKSNEFFQSYDHKMYCHIFMNHSVLCTLFNLSRGDLEQANAPELLYYGDKTTRQFRRCCVADQAAGLRSCRKMAHAFTVYKYAFAADSGPPFDGCLDTLYSDVCSASTVINDTFGLLVL